MVYTLWGEPNSGSFMIEAALVEAGQPYELIDKKDEHHKPDYLALNPSGKIPALRFPDGALMTQSAAILIALDETHPEARLLPRPGEPQRRASLRWLIHIVTEVYPLVEMSDYPFRFAPPETSEVGMRSLVRTRIRERWRLVEKEAAPEGTFLLGRFSAIDLALAVLTQWMIGPDWLRKECPKLDLIARATAARPKVAPIWQRHFQAGAAAQSKA
jgi:glutathione S-transferase